MSDPISSPPSHETDVSSLTPSPQAEIATSRHSMKRRLGARDRLASPAGSSSWPAGHGPSLHGPVRPAVAPCTAAVGPSGIEDLRRPIPPGPGKTGTAERFGQVHELLQPTGQGAIGRRARRIDVDIDDGDEGAWNSRLHDYSVSVPYRPACKRSLITIRRVVVAQRCLKSPSAGKIPPN